MCGIAGFFKVNKKKDEERDKKIFDITSMVFEDTKSRGADASGFSYLNAFNELKTVKGPISSAEMVKEEKWLALAMRLPNSLIAHCRAWTKGEPLNNFNNHPIVVNKEIALIHNGCINNDEDIKGQCVTPAKGEVDSEAIPLLIQTNLSEELGDDFHNPAPTNIIKAINETAKEIYGGYACGMLHKGTPDFLYLFDHGNPVVLAYVPELETIFFASEVGILKKAFEKFLPEETAEETETHHYFFKFSKKTMTKQRYSMDRVSDNTIIVLGFVDKPELGENGVKIENKFEMLFFDLESNASKHKPNIVTHNPTLPQGVIELNERSFPNDDDEIEEILNRACGIAEVEAEVEEQKYVPVMPKRKPYLPFAPGNLTARQEIWVDEEDWRQFDMRQGFV